MRSTVTSSSTRLPRLRQGRDRPGAGDRDAVLHRRCRRPFPSTWRGPTRCSTRPASARRRRHAVFARAAAGAVVRVDAPDRRLCAPGAAAVSASTPRSSTTIPAPISRRSTPTMPSTLPIGSPVYRNDPAISTTVCSRAACRPACPSPTSTATTIRRWTDHRRGARRPSTRQKRARHLQALPAARRWRPADHPRWSSSASSPWRAASRASTVTTIRAGRRPPGPTLGSAHNLSSHSHATRADVGRGCFRKKASVRHEHSCSLNRPHRSGAAARAWSGER